MRPTYLAVLLLAAIAAPQGRAHAQSHAQDHAQGQVKLGPRSFFPKEYTGKAYVDMGALLDTALWEEVERSLVTGPLLAAFRMNFGFRLRDLDNIRIGMVPEKITYPGGYESYRQQAVTVFTGQRKLSLPGPRKREWDYNRRTREQVGGYKVVQEGIDAGEAHWIQPMLWVHPEPGCLVYGDKRLVQPVLEGRHRGGVPHPELMAFTAFPGRRPLAYLALKLEHDEKFLRNAAPFPYSWYTADDKPTFLMLRLTEDGETGSAEATLRMRFTDGSKGPGRFEKKVKESFKLLDTDPGLERLKFLKKYIKKLAFKKSGADLEISCHLGDAKKAVELGMLSRLAPMLWFTAAAAAPAPAVVEVVEEEEIEEEEEEDVERKRKAEAKAKKAKARAEKAKAQAKKAKAKKE